MRTELGFVVFFGLLYLGAVYQRQVVRRAEFDRALAGFEEAVAGMQDVFAGLAAQYVALGKVARDVAKALSGIVVD